MAVFSPVSGILSDRLGASAVIIFSLLLLLVTFVFMGYGIGPETTGIACVVGMVLIGVSMGFYNRGILANGITDAPVHTKIEGFRNIAFSSAALIFCAYVHSMVGQSPSKRFFNGGLWPNSLRSEIVGSDK